MQMIIFHNLQNKSSVTTNAVNIVSFKTLNSFSAKHPTSEFIYASFFFYDIEEDFFEIEDDHDLEYAKTQGKSVLHIYVLEHDDSNKSKSFQLAKKLTDSLKNMSDLERNEQFLSEPLNNPEISNEKTPVEKQNDQSLDKNITNTQNSMINSKENKLSSNSFCDEDSKKLKNDDKNIENQQIQKIQQFITETPKSDVIKNQNSSNLFDFERQVLVLEKSLHNHVSDLSMSIQASSNSSHKKNNIVNKVKHADLNCIKCDKIIIGKRFRCMECNDFDLCEICEGKVNHAHTLIRFNEKMNQDRIKPITQLYNLYKRLKNQTEKEMRLSILQNVTNMSYPSEFYSQFLSKQSHLSFGEYVEKVLAIFE